MQCVTHDIFAKYEVTNSVRLRSLCDWSPDLRKAAKIVNASEKIRSYACSGTWIMISNELPQPSQV